MQRLLRCLMFATLLVLAPAARATFHIVTIDEIYSNADGTIQYMELLAGANFQNQLSGHTILNTGPGGQTVFLFLTDIPGSATFGKRILVATQGFAALNLIAPDYIVPNGFFPITNGKVTYGEGASQWTYDALPTDGVNALMANGMPGPNVATNFAGASASVTPAAPVQNYQGLWWNPAESYWGVNFAHQGDQVFATWYTYDTSGNAYWLSMLAGRTTANSYQGDINVDVGPPFNNYVGAFNFGKVGTGTITFTDANNGTFAYNVTNAGGQAANVTQAKAITRYSLGGAQPTCTYSANPNLAGATNYQDLWWVPTEAGWGVNFAHQGDQLFATWYTYDAKLAGNNNAPLWLSALMTRPQGTGNVFTGPLTRTSGPRFDNYKTSDVVQPIPAVGTATVTFTDGNHASFHYVTDGTDGLPVADQMKSITRFLFAATGATTCQ